MFQRVTCFIDVVFLYSTPMGVWYMPNDREHLCICLKGMQQIEYALAQYGKTGESYEEASFLMAIVCGLLLNSASCMEEHASA